MNTTTGTPLGGFEERLLRELREIVAQGALQAPRQRTRLLRAIARTPRRVPKRWATVGAVAVAVAVAVLVLGTTGGGPSKAFAGWSTTPTTPASGQLQGADAACQQENPSVASLAPTVADTRGPYAMLVWADGSTITNCTAGAQGTLMSSVASAAQTSIAPDAIEVESGGATITGQSSQTASVLDGQAGADVTAVTLILDDGSSVQTTVANGWFAAWWPGSQGIQSAEITTASGTTTQQLNMPVPPVRVQPAPTTTAGTGTSTSGAPGATGTTPTN